MANPWENDDCATMQAHYAVYSIPQAAAVWCGVPEERLEEVLSGVTPISASGLWRCIYRRPSVPCIEPRSRAIV